MKLRKADCPRLNSPDLSAQLVILPDCCDIHVSNCKLSECSLFLETLLGAGAGAGGAAPYRHDGRGEDRCSLDEWEIGRIELVEEHL